MFDIGRISESDRSNIIDQNVVRTQRKLYREENSPNTMSLSGIYFDGKKDKTLQKDGTKKIDEHNTDKRAWQPVYYAYDSRQLNR